jgi:hypothetical protein
MSFAYLYRITLFILVFAIISCKQKTGYTKEISSLDSVETILAGTEKILLSVDTGSLRTSYNSTKGNLHAIMEKISGDTVKKKTAMFLTSAYEYSGNMLNLLNNKKFMERAVSESRQRISDLKHDLNENLIEKNKSAEYVVHELNASGKIYDAVNKAIERARSSSAKSDSMKTQIAFIADSLKLK